MKAPEAVLSEYGIRADSIESLSFGHIHGTYKVHAQGADSILQWVNPIFGPQVMEDIEAVTAHLREKGVPAFEVLKTKAGGLSVPDERGFWRLLSYLPGETFLHVGPPQVAREAGRVLGEFHKALEDCTHDFKHARELHRATPVLYQKYKEAMALPREPFDPELEEALREIDALPSLFLPDSLPKRVTHGDPKISNVLFRGEAGYAIVDLDDLRGDLSVLVDLGDALRSWCQGEEDSGTSTFSMEHYQAALAGYLEGSRDLLTAEERRLVPQSVKLITLELACRFARDIVEDSYFGWDEHRFKSRREHNRMRTLTQIAFYKDLKRKEGSL
jgi:Ser/Thr protein kinase RdoA (MazF antagonist)